MSTKRPKKVISGTGQVRTFKVIKGSSDTREMRCTNPKCGNVALQVPDGKGGTIYKCITCGTKYSFDKF